MAESEIRVLVTTEADLRDAEELQEVIEEVQQKADELRSEQLQLQFEADTQAVEEAENEIEELKALIEAAEADPVHVNVDGEEIEAAKERVDELEQSLLDLQATAANSELNMLKDLAGDADEAKNSIDGVTESASGLEGAMGALAGAAAAAGLMEMVDTAGNISDSWNRLELTFGGVSDSMKQSIDSAAAATGRSGGTIRGYFNQMGIAGVTNTDLLSRSFEALSGRAYQTGNSIESMENVMQRMVLSGNAGARQLTQLGISTEDLGRAMGVSADEASKAFQALSQEDRLRVLTQAMGDGKQANEDYKNSWQGVKDQASAAFAGLMGAVGTPILQMLIPAMKLATNVVKTLSSGFKALPGPLQAVIGGIGAGVAIFAAFAGAIGVAGQVLGGLKAGIDVIRSLSVVSKALGAVRQVLTIINGALAASEWAALGPILLVVAAVVAVIAILWYLYNTNEDVRAAIDNFIQTLGQLPEIITGAVMGAIEWLQGAWQNMVDWFTNGANAISEGVTGAFTWLSESITGTFNGAVEWLQGAWQNTVDFFTNGATMISETVTNTFNWIYETITGVFTSIFEFLTNVWQGIIDLFMNAGSIITETLTAAFQFLTDIWNTVVNLFMTYAPIVAQVLFVMATGGVGAIVLLVANFMGMPNQVGGALQNVISRVLNFASQLVSRFTSAASQAVNNFMNGIRQMPSMVAGELDRIWQAVVNWGQNLVNKFTQIGGEAYNALKRALGIGSPGYMFYMMEGELGRIEHIMENNNIPSKAGELGRDLISAWNNPQLDIGGRFDIDGSGDNLESKFDVFISRLEDILNNMNHGNMQGNITFNHYGDTDDEDKMYRILEFIQRAVDWDNETAGRKVGGA